jgi:hypothetical protein
MQGFEIRLSQPGYLSLVIDKLKRNPDLARDFKASLVAIRGIHRVEIDPEQGLVEVSYDKKQLNSFMSLLALKSTLTTFFPEVNTMQLASMLNRSM